MSFDLSRIPVPTLAGTMHRGRPLRSVVVSGSGSVAALSAGPVTVWCRELFLASERLLQTDENITGMAWSDDGEWLVACTAHGDVHAYQASTRHMVVSRGRPNHILADVRAVPGQPLFSVAGDGFVFLYDPRVNERKRVIRRKGSEYHGVSASSDGELLAFGEFGGRVHVLRTDTLRPACDPLYGDANLLYDVAFHPTRPILASIGQDKILMIHDVAQGRSRTLGVVDDVTKLQFVCQGTGLITWSLNGGPHRVWGAEGTVIVGPLPFPCTVRGVGHAYGDDRFVSVPLASGGVGIFDFGAPYLGLLPTAPAWWAPI